jgi:hypothetical protein
VSGRDPDNAGTADTTPQERQEQHDKADLAASSRSIPQMTLAAKQLQALS